MFRSSRTIDARGLLCLAWASVFGILYVLMVLRERGTDLAALIRR